MQVISSFCKKQILAHRVILLIALFYFFLHLINLTLLPIFNDESIYLDWGWTSTHTPGRLYDAQYDAKQPLMLWIFGLAQNFFPDSLFAGRFVSVFVGFTTLLGIYQLTTKLLTKKIAIWAALLFAITPIFVFYNRQALLEAGVASIGIWSCIALLNVIKDPTAKNSGLLGTILGVGFLIKSSILLFVVSATAILGFFILKNKQRAFLKAYGIALLAFVAVNFLIFINPIFWENFHTNSRYSYTIAELFGFPIAAWTKNILALLEICFVFLSPTVFCASIVGMYLLFKKHIKLRWIFLSYFLIVLLLEVLSAKTQNQRYLVSFLPFLTIPGAYALYVLWGKALWRKCIVTLVLLPPLMLSLFHIFNPEVYIMQLAKISVLSDIPHAQGQTSGHGIREAMQYIYKDAGDKRAMVLFAFNVGNPESAIDVYAQRSPNLAPMHINANMFSDVGDVACLTSRYPVYLVTRNDQTSGMERFFSLERSFANPDPTYSVRIYTLKKECTGKKASLSDVYQPTMDVIFQRKAGIY